MKTLLLTITEKMKGKNGMRAVLALISVLFFFFYVTAITFIDIPGNNVRNVDIILGALIANVIGCVYQYFYGSSQGSADKNEFLRKDEH